MITQAMRAATRRLLNIPVNAFKKSQMSVQIGSYAQMSYIKPGPIKRPSKKNPDEPQSNTNPPDSVVSEPAKSESVQPKSSMRLDQSFQRPYISSIFSNVKTVPYSYEPPSSTMKPAEAVQHIKSHIFFRPHPDADVDEEFDTPQQSFSSSSFKTEHLQRPATTTVEHIFVNFKVKYGWFSNSIQISFPETTPPYVVCSAADALRDFLEDRPAGVDFTGAKLHAPTLVQTGSDWNRYHYNLQQKEIWGSVDPLTIQGVILDALVNRVACEFVTSTSFGSTRNYSVSFVFTHIPLNAPSYVEDDTPPTVIASSPVSVSTSDSSLPAVSSGFGYLVASSQNSSDQATGLSTEKYR